MRAAIPPNERDRLKTLRRYEILDTPPEMTYDDLTLLAAEICGTPIAAVSLLDADRQWFKSSLGLDVTQTPRDGAFCAHALLNVSEPLVVEDATKDARFVDSTLVTGSPGVRFYAGTPLVMSDGNAIGTLCVIDRVPRVMTPKQLRALEILGREVVARLELRRNQHLLEQSVQTLGLAESEMKRTQQEQLDLKDQFISHVSHELRSPLTPIYQFTTILLDEIGGPLTEQQREYLSIVLRNAEQLRGMIGDLLEVTRAQTGKLTVDPRRIRVETVVSNLVQSREVTARANGITLTWESGESLPEVLGDTARVQQIVANLIENAIKFTPEGGSISVHASVRPEEPDAVCVSVRDTGAGLEPADCERVFEQLFQVSGNGERSRNGLGLGLYISRELALRQGGRIWVESEKGKGSQFSFTLPAFRLEPLLMPMLTEENLAHKSIAVITVDLLPASAVPGEKVAKEAMDAVWADIGACVHPSMDVLLPRFEGSEKGETFVVVAMADAQGAERIVARIEERLSRCDAARAAGFGATVSRASLVLPESTDYSRRDAVAEEIVRMLDGQVDDLCREGVV